MSIVKSLVALSADEVMLSTAAFAQQMAAGRADLMSSVPASNLTVTDWYKQPVYEQDPTPRSATSTTCWSVRDGEINAVIIGVGGFLGAGEKDVAVNFSAIKKTTKDSKTYLTMDTTKDALKKARRFKYDSDKTDLGPRRETVTTPGLPRVRESLGQRPGLSFVRAKSRREKIRPLDQRPLRQLFVEILCDPRQHPRIGQGHRTVRPREHPHPAQPGQCLVGVHER